MSRALQNSPKTPRTRRQRLVSTLISAFVWLGGITLYYLVYSLFFDTPTEYLMKHSTDRLREEYQLLEARYDSLRCVADNIIERDRSIFAILFNSEPYLFDEERVARSERYEEVLSESNMRLKRQLRDRTRHFEERFTELVSTYDSLNSKMARMGTKIASMPSIQPVVNEQLSLLTASYGMRFHPFYKTLKSHPGVDYTIPEGSRVFATADGRVKEVSMRSTSGRTIIIDHGNGYETQYSHLGKIQVRKGERVSCGDIIALSGNSGLSLSPHLHYEVRHNGMRVDPIHYFFRELSPEEYYRIIRIAQSGMQSFD